MAQTPLIQRQSFGWMLVTLYGLLSVILVISYFYSFTNNGLFIIASHENVVIRFLWCSGPTFMASVTTNLLLNKWALDLFVVAPYVALERGNAKAGDSVDANYAISGFFSRILCAWRNRKWELIALATAVFLGSCLDTAASGLIISQNVMVTSNVSVQITASLGLSSSPDGDEDGDGNNIFLSSDQYLAASLFTGGQQLYSPLPVPFSYYGQAGNWSITPLSLHTQIGQDAALTPNGPISGGYLSVDTYGININANCQLGDVAVGDNGTINAAVDGCSFTFNAELNSTYPLWHFANSTQCNNATSHDIAFKAFVYVVYKPSEVYSTTDANQFIVQLCRPFIAIAKVRATLPVSQGMIGALLGPPEVLESFSVGRPTDDSNVANLLEPPLNGMAVNGYDIAEPAGTLLTSRAARANLTKAILSEAIYGNHLLNQMGPNTDDLATSWFNSTQRARVGNIVSDFYQVYLNTLSPHVYYKSSSNMTTGSLTFSSARAVVSGLHASILFVLLWMIIISIAITLYFRSVPQHLAVKLLPSTIASIVGATSSIVHFYLSTKEDFPNKTMTYGVAEGEIAMHGGDFDQV